MNSPPRVAHPPSRPEMIYDGDCRFCRLWIRRWQQSTGDAVGYTALQDAKIAERFPELPRAQLEKSVHLIQTDGSVCRGAEAVFRSLATRHKFPLVLYNQLPGFAACAEFCYRIVARHRPFFSAATRVLWGQTVEAPTYVWARWMFLRLLGVTYLLAFASLWSQIIGLVGHNGLMPADRLIEAVNQNAATLGAKRFWLVPTFCWLDAGDTSLQLQCGAGVVLSLLLAFNLAPALCGALLWALYLSLTTACGVFLGYQWDNLLLEVGLLAVLFAPWQFRPRLGRETPVLKLPLWLLRWLLFRLMFASGCVKLLSGDATWHNLTALNFHYETQPLPTWIGWYAHQPPEWFQKTSTVVMFAIELVVPFLIFLPRRPRWLAFWLFLAFQLLIALTGNYTFFNLITVVLCVVSLDDAGLRTWIPARWRTATAQAATGKDLTFRCQRVAAILVGVPVLILSAMLMLGMLRAPISWPSPCLALYEYASPLRSVNRYGLFAVMTTTRNEIIVEGSNDGEHWQEYEFKWKPGDLKRRPGFVAPHQPRLDWQMWFGALGDVRGNPWFVNLCYRLLQGEPEVIALLEKNPFPDAPPKLIRARLYEYHFTSIPERRQSGQWWKREFKTEYCPALSLNRGASP